MSNEHDPYKHWLGGSGSLPKRDAAMTVDDATARARAWCNRYAVGEAVESLATLLLAVAREARVAELEAVANDLTFDLITRWFFAKLADWLRRRAAALREGT